jgi:hypothetical protein
VGDIQNGQEPKHEADTDLEKDIVSPTHFNQQLGLSLFGVGEAGRVGDAGRPHPHQTAKGLHS